MASIDTLVVDSRFDPAGYKAGLAETERAHTAFESRVGARPITVPVDVKLNGLETATTDLHRIENLKLRVAPATVAPPDFAGVDSAVSAESDRLRARLVVPVTVVPPDAGRVRDPDFPEVVIPTRLAPPDLRPIQADLAAKQPITLPAKVELEGADAAVARINRDPDLTVRVPSTLAPPDLAPIRGLLTSGPPVEVRSALAPPDLAPTQERLAAVKPVTIPSTLAPPDLAPARSAIASIRPATVPMRVPVVVEGVPEAEATLRSLAELIQPVGINAVADFTASRDAARKASADIQASFDQAIDAAGLSAQGAAAAKEAGQQIVGTLRRELDFASHQVFDALFPPEQAVASVNRALDLATKALQSRIAQIPPVELRSSIAPPEVAPAATASVDALGAAVAETSGELAGFNAEQRALITEAAAMTQAILKSTGAVNAFDLDAIIEELAKTGGQFRATSAEGIAFQAVIQQIKEQRDALTSGGGGGGGLLPPTPPPTGPTPRLLASQEDTKFAQNRLADAAALAEMDQAIAKCAVDQGILTDATRDYSTAAVAARAAAAATTAALQEQAEITRAASVAANANASALAAGAGVAGAAAAATARATAGAEGLAASMASVAAGSRKMELGVKAAGDQAKVLAEVERAVTTGTGRMAAGFAGATLQRATQDAERLGKGLTGVGQHAEGSAHGIGTITRELVAMGAQAAGAESEVARLAAHVLILGGGVGIVAALAAGVLALATVYNFVHTAEQAAREEEERHLKVLRDQVAAIPANVTALKELAAARENAARADRGIASRVFETVVDVVTLINPQTAGTEVGLEIARRDAEAKKDAARITAQAEANVTAAIQDQATVNARATAQAITGQTASNLLRQQAAGLIRILQAAEQDVTRTLEQQQKAHEARLALQQALNIEVNKEIAARNFIAQQDQQRIAALAAAAALGTTVVPGRANQTQAGGGGAATVGPQIEAEIQLQLIIAKTSQSLTERNQAIERANTLAQGALAPIRQQQAAQRQAETDATALKQQGIAARLSAARTGLQAELVSQQQFFQASRALNAQAAALDVAALRADLARTQRLEQQRGLSPAALAELTVTEGHLKAQIVLRGEVLKLTQAQSHALEEQEAFERTQANAAAAVTVLRQSVATQGQVLLPIGIDITGALEQVTAARDAIVARIQASVNAGQVANPQDTAKLGEAEAQLRSVLELPARVLIESVGALSSRLASLQSVAESTRQLATLGTDRPETVVDVAARHQALVPVLDLIQQRVTAIGLLINDEATPITVINDLYREQAGLLETLSQHQAATPLEITQVQPIQEAAQRYADAKQVFEATARLGLTKEAHAAADVMEDARKTTASAADTAVRVVLALHLTAAETQKILQEIQKELDKTDQRAGQVSLSMLRIGHSVSSLGEGISIIGHVSETIRGVGRDAGDAIGNVEDLGNSVKDLGTSIATGNIAGIISSGINIIGTAGKLLGIGKSDRELALEAAARENAATLHRLTLAWEEAQGRFRGAGGAAEQRTIVQRVLDDPAAQAAIKAGDLNAFRAAVEATGISLNDLREIARANGISLVRDHELVKGSAVALAKAQELAAQAATHFANDIGTQTAILETEDKLGIGGRSKDEQQASVERTRQIQLDNLKLSDAEEQRVRSIDLSTKAGREAFRQWEISLLERAKAGQLTQEELDNFKNVGELLPTIDQAATGLNGLSDAAKDATDRMNDFNLPSGFRRGAFDFAAQALPGKPDPVDVKLVATPGGPVTATTVIPTVDIPPEAKRGTDGAAAPSVVPSVNIAAGAIVIQQQQGESMEALAERILQKMRERAMAQSGDTLQSVIF